MGAHQSADRQRRRSLRSLLRLAKVEMQLVMHFLDWQSRLRAARCSRTLLAAASDPFAWQHGAARLRVNRPLSGDLPAQLESCLLRFAPIALHFEPGCVVAVGEVVSIPRLHELRIFSGCTVTACDQLLAHPALADLHKLRLPDQVSRHAIQMAAALPKLQLLSLRSSGAPGLFEPLRARGTLPELEIRFGPQTSEAQLAALGRLTHLRSLRLLDAGFTPGSFARFCATPSMQGVRHLAFDSLNGSMAQIDGREYAAAFAQLQRMQSMRLWRAIGVDAMLAQLHHAPSLRLLVVECMPESVSEAAPERSTRPSFEALQSLLAAAPLLTVHLRPAPLEQWLFMDSQAAHIAAGGAIGVDIRRGLNQFEELQRIGLQLRPRVCLTDIDDD